MVLAAGPLALWGAWALWVALPNGHWMTAVLGGGALVTAAGLLLLRVWAKPMAYLFAAGLALAWIYTVWQVALRGWPYPDWPRTVIALVPGALLLIVCAGGAWVVHKQYRRHAGET